jgi:predicted alpha/beta hydrolase family esterase
VKAALLVAVPDLERDDVPPQLHGWRQVAQQALPFPALMVIRNDDPESPPDCAAALAARWCAPTVREDVRPRRGDWPEGQAWVAALKRQALAGMPSAT